MKRRRKKRKLKINFKYFLVVLIIMLIALQVTYYLKNKVIENNNTKEISKLDYSKESIKIIEKEVSKKNQDYLIDNQIKETEVIPIIKETYYIDDYLIQYLEYQKTNVDKSTKDIITAVNTHINEPFLLILLKQILLLANMLS